MFESGDNLEAHLNALVFRALKGKSDFNEINSYDWQFDKWPSCSAKSVFSDLLSKTSSGYEYAQSFCVDKYSEWFNQVSDYGFPSSVKLANEKVIDSLKVYLREQLRQAILREPQRIDELIEKYISNKPTGVRLYSLESEIKTLVERQLEKVKSGEAMVILPDFPLLSGYVGGFNPSWVTIITALSGFGKTNLAVSLGLSASKIMDVLYFNMEMDYDNFAARFLHNAADVSNEDWRTGKFVESLSTQNNILNFATEVQDRNQILFTDGKALSAKEINSTIYNCFDGSKKGLVIIDYDQKILMDRSRDEWKELLYAISSFEETAKRTKTHVIVLSQGDESGDIKASKRMRQAATNLLHFTKEKNPFDPLLETYMIKGLKTRYSGDKAIQLGVDLAKSKVFELGLIEPQIMHKKGKYEF